MFTHILVGTNDPDAAKAFYDLVLGALDIGPSVEMKPGRYIYPNPAGGPGFGVGAPLEGKATAANGGTIGFGAKSREAVDAFHAAGLKMGGSCAGAPGPRPYGQQEVYGAYLRDPDGNKICCFSMA